MSQSSVLAIHHIVTTTNTSNIPNQQCALFQMVCPLCKKTYSKKNTIPHPVRTSWICPAKSPHADVGGPRRWWGLIEKMRSRAEWEGKRPVAFGVRNGVLAIKGPLYALRGKSAVVRACAVRPLKVAGGS